MLKTNMVIGSYLIQGVGNFIKNQADAKLKRQQALQITADSSKRVLDKLNVKIEVDMCRPDLFTRNYFMVCNHMSYLDILVLSSVHPAVFVTSKEMEKTFFLGDMAKLGGSFFVDRVNRRKMKDEVQALADLIGEGFDVFIFPEGTSTDGSQVQDFKKSLFRVPFQTGAPILPICLQYQSIDGEPFSQQNCDRVCWYGDMTFAPHFLQLMTLKELKVKLTYLEPLEPSGFESHGDLAVAVQDRIRATYNS